METTLLSSAEQVEPVQPAPMSQSSVAPCPTCGSAHKNNPPTTTAASSRQFIYAIGHIEARSPSLATEKEYAQLLAVENTQGKTDREAFYQVISKPANRYVANQLCWVLVISEVETYLVVPRREADLNLLIESIKSGPDTGGLDAIIGVKGPLAPASMCNGLSLPVVAFEQLYSFNRDTLLKAIPRPDKATEKEFLPVAGELFDRVRSGMDNTGSSDRDRALNYLVMRDKAIYARVLDGYRRDLALTSIEAHPSSLSTSRRVIKIVLRFTHRKNEFVEKWAVAVDVQEAFPFLASKWTLSYDS